MLLYTDTFVNQNLWNTEEKSCITRTVTFWYTVLYSMGVGWGGGGGRVILMRMCELVFPNLPHSYTWPLRKKSHSYTWSSEMLTYPYTALWFFFYTHHLCTLVPIYILSCPTQLFLVDLSILITWMSLFFEKWGLSYTNQEKSGQSYTFWRKKGANHIPPTSARDTVIAMFNPKY